MKNVLKTATLSLATAGLFVLSCPASNAQTMDAPMTAAPAPAPMMEAPMPSMAPMMVTGTVVRYYVDRAGYVSAMDVQTADGVKMVRFSPSMAQKVTGMFPVGSTATVSAMPSMMGTMTRYDLAGVGEMMPAPGAMMPVVVSELDVLKAQPYVMIGTKAKAYNGKLTGYIAEPNSGEVLAIILDDKTLVRVPVQNRLPQASMSPEGVTGLLKGADVLVSGIEEAPRYGVVSPYETRVAATGITIGGQTLGPFGFGKVVPSKKNSTLFGFDLNLGDGPEEVAANEQGYATYMTPAPPAPPAPTDAMAPAPMAPADGTMPAPMAPADGTMPAPMAPAPAPAPAM